MKEMQSGVYPTMITPYKNGEIDYGAVDHLVEWYIENGCKGIFAVCQSSEMAFLSLRERVQLGRHVVKRVNGRINVVVSGHISNSLIDQAEELGAMWETGADAVVLVTNRLDLNHEGDDVWIGNAEALLSKLNKNMVLGLYECPRPYKRLLTDTLIDWCIRTGRITFIKDTCCDPDLLTKRLRQIKGSSLRLFNANEQTLLFSLKECAAGYSGIMANFHPKLLAWLCENYDKKPEKAELLSDILSMSAFTESEFYPTTAKYYLNLEAVRMELDSRAVNKNEFNAYQRLIVEQMYHLNHELMKRITEEEG